MKHVFTVLLLMLVFKIGLSQNFSYDVRGVYKRSVKKETLQSAKLISDVIEGYPIHWITGYSSVEISAICNGKKMTVMNTNETLSAEQKNLLHAIELGTGIEISIKYYYKVPVTNVMEHNIMQVSMTVIPEIEAEYRGGYKQLLTYLKENAIDKISITGSKPLQQVIIKFTINEQGEIEHPRVIKTFGKRKTDKLLLKVIRNMPKWKPAEEGKDVKVKQDFEFIVGSGGGC